MDPHAAFATALRDRYELQRELGRGGMATVYLAHDVRHRRQVALKVLKPELTALLGVERFVQEITTTAALQHPHILPLFDSGEAAGFIYYVMPYIEGETLRGRLDRETQLAVDEAVRLTVDIGDALHYAHSRGVIHRDVKPENILLHDGRPMVADFGIALAISAAAGGRMTETGLSLGTPHYMSPEQATADKALTPRSDVYSLGSMLYEMLAGDPPHTGSSSQQIIMRIIADAPRPVTELRKAVPPHVAAAVAKALEKLPADRFASAREFIDALRNPAFTHGVTTAMPAPTSTGARRRALYATLLVAGGAGGGLGIAAAGVVPTKRASDAPVTRLDLSLGEVVPYAVNATPILSPDGRTLVIAGTMKGERAIFARDLGGDGEFRKIAGTDEGLQPVFSPDGKWIAFSRRDEGGSGLSLVKVPVSGGAPVRLLSAEYNASPRCWTEASQLHVGFMEGGAQVGGRISGDGGAVARHSTTWQSCAALPGGNVVYDRGQSIFAYDVRTDSSYRLVAGLRPIFVAPNLLLFVDLDAQLQAVPFDPSSLRLVGQPRTVLSGVGGYTVSNDGTLIYRTGRLAQVGAVTRIVMHEVGGRADTLSLAPAVRQTIKFAPSGELISFSERRRGSEERDVYVFDLRSNRLTRVFEGITSDVSLGGLWSPDGTRLLLSEVRGGRTFLSTRAADGSATITPWFSVPGEFGPSQWLEGDTLVAFTYGSGTDIYMLSPRDSLKPAPYLQAPWTEIQVQVSPDHQLATHLSMERAPGTIMLREYPAPIGRWPIAVNATSARWSRADGSIWYWIHGTVDSLYRTPIARNPVRVGARTLVGTSPGNANGNWDLHPDGRRFVRAVPADAGSDSRDGPRIFVVLNWAQELRKRFANP